LYSKDGYRIKDIYPEAAKKCLLLPDDPMKTRWEIFISLILIFTATTTPYRLAFIEKDDDGWTALNYATDSIFAIDIIICFCSAYEDENEDLVHDKWIIAKGYLKSWFFIDIISIVPIAEFLETSNFASLARIARLPKLYRLIKMFKLIRLLKVIKERNTISKYLNEVLKLSVALERLVFFCFIFVVLVHIVACFWVILASFEDDPNNFIFRNNLTNSDDTEQYVAAFYFTTVIVTTIGYGDITVRTPIEQVFCIFLLITGVVGFSFAIGSLSSVISSLDSKAAKLKEKLSTLEDIRNEYKIPYDLYRRLRLAMNYDHSKNADEQMNFLNELP
jgi:voltage-gated potassium channel Kch